ncbi:MAG: YicC family protein [Candidatus Omnitrophica bacterium]|nr:YicC family protein [Candidatus Omnitrophota bacterium]
MTAARRRTTPQSSKAIQSMTGYGRATRQGTLGTVTVELRSTNHRYLEIDQRLPNGLAALQGRTAELLRATLRRGRIDAVVNIQQSSRWQQHRVQFDEPLLQRYVETLTALKNRFGVKGPLTLDHLLALPHALTVVEDRLPPEQAWEAIRQTVQAAALELVRSRSREGAKLVADLRRQLATIHANLQAIKRRLPKALAQQRQRVRERLLELLGPGASGGTPQLEQAAALVKDVDVHEEMVRLESHLTYMRQTLSGATPLVGKRLDFIAQELMREANTLGAKVNDPGASQHVVDIKGCIEKIREQVQNLE